MKIRIGTYTGDGNNPRSITGVGFKPNVLIIKGGSNQTVWKSTQMDTDGGDACCLAAASNIASILSLDTDGFTVNSAANVNAAATAYFWIAFFDNGAGDFTQGKYTGTGVAGKTVSTGFQPALVITKRNSNAASGVWRGTSHSGDDTSQFANQANITGGITSLDATTFTVGTNTSVNTNLATYYFFAFQANSAQLAFGTYTGNGSDDREITAAWSPDIVFDKAASGANTGVFRTASMTGDTSAQVNAASFAANLIQRFDNTPGFQVGTAATVNGNTIIYYWFAFRVYAIGGDLTEGRNVQGMGGLAA